MPKSSDVWAYFERLADEKAKCKKCKAIFSQKGGSTKSLWDHLKCLHKEILEEMTTESTPQKTETFLVKKSDNEQEKADELMATIMLRRNESFLFVEDPGIQFIFSKAFPHLKVNLCYF